MTTSTVGVTPAAQGLRPLIWGLYGIPAVQVSSFGLVLLAGIIKAGGYRALIDSYMGPTEVVPFGLHWWNPFAWIYDAAALTLPVTIVVGSLLVLIGAGNLARPTVRANRRAWVRLLGGVLCSALLIALLFSPAADKLITWWAD